MDLIFKKENKWKKYTLSMLTTLKSKSLKYLKSLKNLLYFDRSVILYSSLELVFLVSRTY